VIPVGYSHGYPFQAAHQSRVLIRDKFYPVVGRISMDYLTVNIGGDSVDVQDIATLIGRDTLQMIRAEEIAQAAGTIPYEIVARISRQIPRVIH